MADTPNINDVMNQIQSYIDNYDNFEENGPKDSDQHQPTIGELDQFRKNWFYDDWQIRFRELNAFYPLGTKGVVAIPNTTFEEWLYWFQQWAIAFEQDYNKFKKLVFDTISLIEKHLEAIDKTLEDHEKRIQALEGEVKQIQDEIAQMQHDIQQLQNDVNQIKSQIQDIYNKLNDINNKIQDLQNQINANDQKHQQEEQHLQDEIDAILKQLHNNIAPNWQNASDEGAGAVNGWEVDTSANPHGFNVQYRWINQDDHSQGLYLNINYNHVYNDDYSPGTKDTIMQVDLTNFVNQTHAVIPNEQWPSSTGSYYTSKQRSGFGLHWTYDSNSHIMTISLDYRDGVYTSDVWPDKIVLINGSTSVYCPVSQS